MLATGDPALGVNCNGAGPVSAEWMIPKALWIARNEPDVFGRAATVCEYQDFMNLRLTGRRCASLNNVSIRWHYSKMRGGPARSLVEKLGVSSLLEKWPSDVLAPGEVIGPLTREAAEHLGLSTDVLVAQGGADALIGMIGLGVHKPGQLALITGSSHLMFGVAAAPASVAGLWGTYDSAVYPELHIIEGGQTSTGSIINWLRRVSGGGMDLKTLNVEAEKLAPGCDGVLCLDHFQGNRTPYVDAMSRGAFVGLTLAHGLPHLFRAAIEGICFGSRAILRHDAYGWLHSDRDHRWRRRYCVGSVATDPRRYFRAAGQRSRKLGSAVARLRGPRRSWGWDFLVDRRRHRGDGSSRADHRASREGERRLQRPLSTLRDALSGLEDDHPPRKG